MTASDATDALTLGASEAAHGGAKVKGGGEGLIPDVQPGKSNLGMRRPHGRECESAGLPDIRLQSFSNLAPRTAIIKSDCPPGLLHDDQKDVQ